MFACRSCSRSIIRAFLSISAEEHGTTLRSRGPNVFQSNTGRLAFSTNPRYLQPEQNSKQNSKQITRRSSEEQARIDAGLPIDIQTYEEAGAAVLKRKIAIRTVKVKSSDSVRPEHVSTLDGKTPIDPRKINRHANLELKHIKESYHLAERCLTILKNGEFDMAVYLVRLAGLKGMDATVSWNHILNSATQAGFLNTSYKLYHEMKKRGQKPDAYTISILLRGYAAQKDLHPSRFETAQTIYESLYLPNSPVKPNIIHSNIMLEICARAEELDVLFKVGSRLSEQGPNSPDQITYTTIFNALSNAKISREGELRLERISQARRIWGEVLEKWKSGSLLLGEELLCSMGRVLLTSPSKEDQDSVFTLIEEFTGIPRQTREVSSLLPEPDLYNNAKAPGYSSSDISSLAGSSEVAEANPKHATFKPYRSLTLDHDMKSSRAAGLILPKPGPKTLSLLLATCAKLGTYKVSIKYWDFLRSQFTPDTFNFIEYMKQIKITGNSSLATVVLRDVYKLSRNRKSTIKLHPALWEHGMNACCQANNGQAALRDATRILIMLQMSTTEPSFSVIELFTKVLSRTKAGFPVEDIMRAAESLMMVFGNFKSLYAFGRTESNGPPPASEMLDEIIADIDPKWQPTAKPPFRLSMSTVSLLTQARSKLSTDERKGILKLARQIEVAFSQLYKMYGDVMTRDQLARIRSDLYRTRAWVFPRNRQLHNEVVEGDIVKKNSQPLSEVTQPQMLAI